MVRKTISGFLEAEWYVFGDRTPGRKKLKPGDRLCFYESGVGIVVHAEVASVPEQKVPPVKQLKNLDKFPWAFRLRSARMYFDDPVIIDAERRAQLDAFAQKDPLKHWAWFVQGTHQLSEKDFRTSHTNNRLATLTQDTAPVP